ncbi:Predicted arabinose efflux permease, MFS family [Actinopolymorpha cephalotaxi]|uniref:MFS family permease n=1 Tax=Actinopolymorpha cephalotaxi TaxID=504797 RepID=A0A1I3AGD4_9ACTN|nr:MFS transporter [Actinopolymorpha cephalotaxi]NYH82126.1 MFS family permease [Actinopolymorpha cephalotaxi]SFH49065.1 Predicted arabinose efflux permease, MFS family [Actinopolymorpha cephalotaxi]
MSHDVKLLDAVRGQPRSVWVVAFAAVIAFMGIGLVDPILLSIAKGLNATPSQVTLLFASYLVVQVLAMLFTGVLAAKYGGKRTMVAGLALIVVFAGMCALAGSIGQLVALRAFWGLGNALFIATALSTIVAAASGGQTAAILLYEAALGLGISAGPLVGALLGSISWRGPFVGTSVLMLVALVLTATMLVRDRPSTQRVSISAPFRALRDRRLLLVALSALLYTYAFFTVLAWTPFVLGYGAFAVGGIFFGWGLMVAVCGVIVGPRLAARIGERNATMLALGMYALLMLAFVWGSVPVVVVATIASGIASGCLNTFLTGMAMSVSQAPRPIASAGYNFLRWMGGAAAAILVGHVAEWGGSQRAPFAVAAVLCAGAVGLMYAGREPNPHEVPAEAVVVGEQV